MAYITATATAFPEYYYPQAELTAALRSVWAESPHRLERMEQFHQNVSVQGRYLARPIEAYTEPSTFQERNGDWIETALNLGEHLVEDILDQSGLEPGEITQLTFTTVTGVAVPSIDARLMNRIRFSPHLRRLPLFGLGCLGGAAGVARQADYLRGNPTGAALLMAIELCSLTIQHGDLSVANMVSSGLFGDGAAAVLMVGDEHRLAKQQNSPRVVDSRSVFFPDTEHIMGWEVLDSGFKVVLSADVSKVAEADLRPGLESFLSEHGLRIDDIDVWVAHPGGPKVIDAMERGLSLDSQALRRSRESLSSVGNLSSASVLAVLDATLSGSVPTPGSWGVLMAMGPAFCAELVLLQW